MCAAGAETNTLAGFGATNCTQCFSSYWDHDRDSSTACTRCEAGNETANATNFPVDVGATLCNQCHAGKYDGDANASTTCDVCMPGAVTETLASNGSLTCTPCSAGWVDDDASSQTPCIPCPAGTFNGHDGQVGNVSCPVCSPGNVTNTLASTGAVACTSCVAGLWDDDGKSTPYRFLPPYKTARAYSTLYHVADYTMSHWDPEGLLEQGSRADFLCIP